MFEVCVQGETASCWICGARAQRRVLFEGRRVDAVSLQGTPNATEEEITHRERAEGPEESRGAALR